MPLSAQLVRSKGPDEGIVAEKHELLVWGAAALIGWIMKHPK